MLGCLSPADDIDRSEAPRDVSEKSALRAVRKGYAAGGATSKKIQRWRREQATTVICGTEMEPPMMVPSLAEIVMVDAHTRANLHRSNHFLLEQVIEIFPTEMVCEMVSTMHIVFVAFIMGDVVKYVNDEKSWRIPVLAAAEAVAMRTMCEAGPKTRRSLLLTFALAELETAMAKECASDAQQAVLDAARERFARLPDSSYLRSKGHYLVFRALAQYHGLNEAVYKEAALNMLYAAEDSRLLLYRPSTVAAAAIHLAVAHAISPPQTKAADEEEGEEDEMEGDSRSTSVVEDFSSESPAGSLPIFSTTVERDDEEDHDEGRRRRLDSRSLRSSDLSSPLLGSHPLEALRGCLDDMECAKARSRVRLAEGFNESTLFTVEEFRVAGEINEEAEMLDEEGVFF